MIVRIQSQERLRNNPKVKENVLPTVQPVRLNFWTQDRRFSSNIIEVIDETGFDGVDYYCCDGRGQAPNTGNVFLCTVEENLDPE